jgi:thiamine biosynthesis protein ThiS
MQIIVNGESKECTSLSTITELLTNLSLKPETVVIELNNEIIQPDAYDKSQLAEADSVEIIRFVGGG